MQTALKVFIATAAMSNAVATPGEENSDDASGAEDSSDDIGNNSAIPTKIAKFFQENPKIGVGAALVGSVGVAEVLRRVILKFAYSCKRQTSDLERDLQSETKATKIKGCNKLTAFETNCPEFYNQIVNYTADCDSILKQD